MTSVVLDWFDPADLVADGVHSFLFCDFDDVLNFFPRNYANKVDRLHPRRKNFRVRIGHDSYRINVDLDVLDQLAQMVADPGVQLVWLTSWRDKVRVPLFRLGFTTPRDQVALDYPNNGNHVGDKHHAMTTVLSKLDTVDAPVRTSLRFVWVDDRATPVDDASKRAVLGDWAGQFMLVVPPVDVGLRVGDLDGAARFLSRT